LKSRSYKVTGFEANLISDTEYPNDFYTIRSKFHVPIDIDDLTNALLDFISDSIAPELADTDYTKNPEVVIIVCGFIISFPEDDSFIYYSEFEIPYVKLSINESGKLTFQKLWEES